MERTTAEVFDDHLRRRAQGDLEGDLERNYAEDVVLFCRHGVLHGRDEIRRSARRLRMQIPDATFAFATRQVEGEVAFLEWSAESPKARVDDGADSFVIRDGLIRVQTIHYTPEPNDG